MISYAMLLTGIICHVLGGDDSDVAIPSLPFPCIHWEANEEERFANGTSSESQDNKKTRKRPYVSEGTDIEDAPQNWLIGLVALKT